ncbi:hypothetical protein [uncultured phage cr131_1]|uniref:Peptidase S74 domain-containing protein n=1 Tax=uncultured phage cr131_1 TaxID=2772093 RepID=A0A7M1RTQ7_9CAUD|nr:hypothetical protein KNV60_gp81 [uncultured phage cr131_1]QOR57718.1 hypothetical protein [uncultured phage cr131_1]
MTNLNIAIPADSKDTEFGTSDILLAKDIVAYLNALDSDISKELTAQTDKINKINESIKQLIDHNLIKIVTELPTTDIDKNCIYLVPNKDGDGNNVFVEYIYVESKNTFEEVGRIQAKVDLSDYYTKEETDNLILIAKNSAINIHNEDDARSIKLDINDTGVEEEHGSTVNVSLIDDSLNYISNINAYSGFSHYDDNGGYGNFCSERLYIYSKTHDTTINSDMMDIYNPTIGGNIRITVDKKLTEEEQLVEDSPIDISLIDVNCSADINANRLIYKRPNSSISQLGSAELDIQDSSYQTSVTSTGLSAYFFNDSDDLELGIDVRHDNDKNALFLGNDYEVGISRIIDNTEGATIIGVKSITAFSNPSATKVWATDGSTVDLSTKANASDLNTKANKSDILLKKSASGGYYVEANSNALGFKAFAVNPNCNASGSYSFAEGCTTTANGAYSHVEGEYTSTYGSYSHSEGFGSLSIGEASHAEGKLTKASGYCSHALGICNVINKNAIHSVGIGDDTTNKNAEYIYAKNDTNSTSLVNDPKNGYKYLIGVGGYDGISTDNTTYKSVQEVIADLTARIEQLETKVRTLEAANTPA